MISIQTKISNISTKLFRYTLDSIVLEFLVDMSSKPFQEIFEKTKEELHKLLKEISVDSFIVDPNDSKVYNYVDSMKFSDGEIVMLLTGALHTMSSQGKVVKNTQKEVDYFTMTEDYKAVHVSI